MQCFQTNKDGFCFFKLWLEPKSARKYDVFISFRGEDTRLNFTSHLHAALKRASLEVFLDEKELEKGDEIAPSLILAIKDSSVSLIVFSQDYASSKWCLDELTQIMKYRKEEGQFVIPIFYNVDPSHVRNQNGAYKEAFEKHEKTNDHEKVTRWKAALFEAANLSGRQCIQTITDESNLIAQIVADVKTKVEHIYKCQYALEDLIGIDEMIKPIEELLEKSHKVGIWGMGGVGKSTMAIAVFAKLSSQYDNHCFLENVREKTERNGLEHVRISLILELFGQDMRSNSSNASRNDELVARMLSRKKALIVLDDVDSSEQMEALQCKICNSLGYGSKVIITTRNKKLLRGKGYNYEIYEAKGLSYDHSVKLFIRKAFGSDNPKVGYEQLIKGFVDYTQHNPLAIEVLGSHVHSEDKMLWDGLLRKLLAGNPNEKIQKMLRLSYEGLDYKEKEIFLDIACFLKGESEELVQELLESYGFYPTVGLQTLKDRALIVTTNGKVEMHDLIQEMGHQIVREENIKEPGKRSRLWDPSEIYDVLENHVGEKRVEGIKFFPNKRRHLKLTPETFNKMTEIRFLNVCSSDYVSIPIGLELITNKLRYLHWNEYPGKSLPSNFCAPLLLELNLERSRVVTLWEEVQDLANLRRLKLQWCHELRELPDFSNAYRLESVDLRGCESLRFVHESLLCLHSLISLDVSYCSGLESLQSRIHLKSLKQVYAYSSFNLKEFSVSSEELTYLDLSGTKIEELRPSMGRCSKLRKLDLPNYIKLKSLPIEVLSCLTSLEKLRISFHKKNDNEGLRALFDHLHSVQSIDFMGWKNLKELPDNIAKLSNLEELHLDGCESLTKLPDNMRHLSQLQLLSVLFCYKLQSLPELPPSLRILDACGCTSLERVSISSTLENCGEKIFKFMGCLKLDLGTIEEQAMRLLQNAVCEKEDVTIIYTGKQVPKWFEDNRTQHGLDTIKLSLSSHNLLGFVFCVVVSGFTAFGFNSSQVDLSFRFEGDEMICDVVLPSQMNCCAGNVLLSSRPELSKSILEKIEGKRRNHGATTCNPNVFFKIRTQFFDSKLIASGVYPIYASECSDLNFHYRKRKAI